MNPSGYNPKDLIFDDVARGKLIAGIEKIAKSSKEYTRPYGADCAN